MRAALRISLVVLLCGACNSVPTQPSNVGLPFIAGTYILSLSGYDAFGVGNGPLEPGCVGLGQSGLAYSLATSAAVSLERGIWTARPAGNTSGSFVLSFTTGPEGPDAPGGVGVSGTASGVAIATLPPPLSGPVPDLRVTFTAANQPTALLTGGITLNGLVATGVTGSPVQMSNSSGVTVSCNAGAVLWELSRSSVDAHPSQSIPPP